MLRGWLCLYFWRVEGWNWARKGQAHIGSVAEWSKALDLGSSLYGGVVQIPLLPAVVLTKAGGPACTRDESENIVRVCFPCQQPGLLRKCESYKMPCPLPQMSVFLLRQGNSVMLLGPHPSCVIYWLLEVPLLTIWVNSVLICSSKYISDLLWQQHSHKH